MGQKRFSFLFRHAESLCDLLGGGFVGADAEPPAAPSRIARDCIAHSGSVMPSSRIAVEGGPPSERSVLLPLIPAAGVRGSTPGT